MAPVDSPLTRALAGRYTIERELGRGGMATVYLARDLRHKRPVALKVLHPELAHALGPERFLREIETAARLQHPHILSVHDSGEAAGHLWFTMPYVDGESLRDRLRREQQLPVDEALRITTEAARALDYAHRQGVVHRDVKPENLLVTRDGDTLVTDFGIGRAFGGAPQDEQLTETGVVVGTPAYMSPEQATGERELDGRSDIYSLGVVLYEMLAGEPPFTGPTTRAVIMRRLTEAPRPIRAIRDTVPGHVEQTLSRALAKTPADRFTSMAEFSLALLTPTASLDPTWLTVPRRFRVPLAAITLALVFVLGLGGLFAELRRHGAEGAEGAGPKRLAVLPFENLGGSEKEYFADGITDEVRGKLAALPELQVTARSSSSQYKRASKSPQQIGQELGVQYLLTGTVRWETIGSGKSRVRVTPELVQAATASTRWQEPFDAPLTDVFQVQADIAARVAGALDVALGVGDRERLAEKPTTNLAAYDAFLKGEELSNSLGNIDPTVLRRALGYYRQAVELDSGFALAWAQLSRAHAVLYVQSEPKPEVAEAARTAAERALALAPARPEAALALGHYYSAVLRDNDRALEQVTRAQRLAPKNTELLTAIALIEERLGRWEAAVAKYRQALTLDPRSVNTARRLTRTLYWLRRYPEALDMSNRALALAPANPAVVQAKVEVYLMQGDLASARAVLRQAQENIEPAALVAYMANYNDLYWVLDEGQQQLLLSLGPHQFDGNRATWGLALAGAHELRGNHAGARAYADSARLALEEQLRSTPSDAQLHSLYGVALAYAGRKDAAIREGERGLALSPISVDAFLGPYLQLQLVRIYLLAGEPERALDYLEPLLNVPYQLSPGRLAIDPTFAPLQGNPRFERLVRGKSP